MKFVKLTMLSDSTWRYQEEICQVNKLKSYIAGNLKKKFVKLPLFDPILLRASKRKLSSCVCSIGYNWEPEEEIFKLRMLYRIIPGASRTKLPSCTCPIEYYWKPQKEICQVAYTLYDITEGV